MGDHLPPKEAMCHCTWFEKSCRDLVVSGACRRWTRIDGMNPQTGEKLDRWDCVDNHVPTILMSIGKATVECGAATESFRNEYVKIGHQQIAQRERAIKALPGAAE